MITQNKNALAQNRPPFVQVSSYTSHTLRLWALTLSVFAFIALPLIQPVHAASNCAKNYKKALSAINQRYSEPLKYAVSISHNKVKHFPSIWRIAPALKLGDKHKRLSKKQRRRSKAGLIIVPQKGATFSALDYTAQEKQILSIADSVVRWRGKDPAFNKRGRYGWLTSRIAADLRVYTGQPAHPALCTGANLMMNHLYDNSGRFRKRIAFIKKLAPLAHQYAAARYRAFQYSIDHRQNPAFVKLGSLEKTISLSLLMNKTAKLFRKRSFLKQVEQEPLFLSTLELIRQYAHLPAKASKPSSGLSPLMLTRLRLPTPKPISTADNNAKKSGQKALQVKIIARHEPSAAHYDILPQSGGIALSALQEKALRKTLSAIEAAYYIDHIAHSYEALNSAIFGAISAVKSAHKTHCRCRS